MFGFCPNRGYLEHFFWNKLFSDVEVTNGSKLNIGLELISGWIFESLKGLSY